MSHFVFVVDQNRVPCDPVHPGVARHLLTQKKAAVLRRYPFTILLKPGVEWTHNKPVQLKLDPGSKTTGMALLQAEQVIWAAELEHRGAAIHRQLGDRRAVRRSRRGRKTRYRKPRFDNRKKPQGWLAPSLLHRVQTTLTWVKRLCRLAPVSNLAMELVKFDTQALQNSEIEGAEYQQGTLAGYQLREYLLEKWNRRCAYCGKPDVPLQVEHILAQSRGGSHRISNLCVACPECNLTKADRRVEEFLSDKPDVLKRILAQAKSPLKDAAAVNATRWRLYQELQALDLPIEIGTGGGTKWNRTRFGLAKAHWLDAACVGVMETISLRATKPLLIRCVGHGTRQVGRTDKFGFPNRHKSHQNLHFGFQTGDRVKAIVTTGKKIGTYIGKVACRATGRFNISTPAGRVQGIGYKNCRVLHSKDGYAY